MLCLGRKSKRSRIAEEVSKMFVSETNIFNPQVVKLCIVNAEGTVWQLDVTPDFSIEKLKVMALGHFFNPVESIKLVHQYKLVSVCEGRALSDDSTILQENIKENDELLLLKKRFSSGSNPDPQDERESKQKGPDEAIITKKTANLEPQNFSRTADDTTAVVDFQTELRKILISLVDASQKILCKNPDVLPIFKSMQEKMEDKNVGDIDPNVVKQLTDMGFSESKAIKALKLNKMSPVEAMEWLLENNIESDIDVSSSESKTMVRPTEITTTSYPTPTASLEETFLIFANGLGVRAGTSSKGEDATSSPLASPMKQPVNKKKGLYSVAEILETFKAYKRKGFRPNSRALHNLKEMGFAEEEIIDALRISGNNQDQACEWLLGERRPTPEEMENGLDPEGPIYKAIISNPVVQLGLNNPKTLLAFLHMLENPNTANHWLNDPDTAPLLSQIFRIYHAEKHSLQVNDNPSANS